MHWVAQQLYAKHTQLTSVDTTDGGWLATAQFVVPHDLPGTIQMHRLIVRWQVEFIVEVKGAPDWRVTFPLAIHESAPVDHAQANPVARNE